MMLKLIRKPKAHSGEGEAGYSLLEMLVVITIIGLIVGLVGPRVLNYLSESKVKTARIQIESLSSALDLYYLDNGQYPAMNEGLAALVQRPVSAPGWNGPYLKSQGVPIDPWGHAYIYKIPATTAPMRSPPMARLGRRARSATRRLITSSSR